MTWCSSAGAFREWQRFRAPGQKQRRTDTLEQPQASTAILTDPYVRQLKREYSPSMTPSAAFADPSTELDIDLLHHYQILNACHENISEKPGSNPIDVAKTRADAGQPSRIDEKAVDPEDRSDRAGAASPDPEPHPSRTMTVRRILEMYDGLRTRPRDADGRRGRFRRVVVESTRAVVWCVTSSSCNARPSRRDGSTPPAPARTFVFSRSEEWVREASVLAWRFSN